MKLTSCICGFLVLIAPGVNGRERLTVAVSPAQSFAPSNVSVKVRFEPNVENRALVVICDSGEFYRRSDIPVEGDRGPATIMFQFPNLPEGEYDVTATVVDSSGRERATARTALKVNSSIGG